MPGARIERQVDRTAAFETDVEAALGYAAARRNVVDLDQATLLSLETTPEDNDEKGDQVTWLCSAPLQNYDAVRRGR
jgi:hypothetical protein